MLFQEPVDFAHHVVAPPARDTAEGHMACSRARPPRRARASSPRAARGAISPSRRDQMRQVRHRRLVGDPRDRRLVDLVAGDPLVEPPDIVLLGSPEKGEPSVTTARTRSGTARASSRANRPPRLQPTSRIGWSMADRVEPLPRAARACRLARPRFQPMLPAVDPPAGLGERAGAAPRSCGRCATKPGMTSTGGPSAGPRGLASRSRASIRGEQPRRPRRAAAEAAAARSSPSHVVTFRGTRPPSAPAAPWAASPGRPRSGGSRAAARGCAGTPARCC